MSGKSYIQKRKKIIKHWEKKKKELRKSAIISVNKNNTMAW